ncbi:hypothetical protein [Pantoea stewartii]|uniref:hypothetical protein n=1 Tax=Pantoea stewartii TaxID=66269 RepID=UPI0019817F1B|nr:hypothetical protein [Pantoea stewartii]
MNLQARVSDNPNNIGNGYWSVGTVLDIISETNCHYILSNGSRVNKKKLFIVGTSYFTQPVRVEIITKAA